MNPKTEIGAPLSARETELLALLAKGFTNPEIAGLARLGLYTVGDHIKAIFVKLDVNSRAEAAVRACEMGLHGTPAAKCDALPETLVARILAECDHEPGTHIDAPTLMQFANRLAAEVRRWPAC